MGDKGFEMQDSDVIKLIIDSKGTNEKLLAEVSNLKIALSELKITVNELRDALNQSATLVPRIQTLEREVKELKDEIKTIKEKPARWWDRILLVAATSAVTSVVNYFIGIFGRGS